jgi:hypothetical protein
MKIKIKTSSSIFFKFCFLSSLNVTNPMRPYILPNPIADNRGVANSFQHFSAGPEKSSGAEKNSTSRG